MTGVRARLAAAGVKDWMIYAGVALLVAVAVAAYAMRAGSEPPPPGSDQFTAAQRKAIEAIARQYILDNGDIIPQAMQRLQDREVGKLLDSNRAEIEAPYGSAWAGAKDGDVVLVEFFDYACPYCRSMNEDVGRLLKEDDKLKVVWRDFPVLGPASEQAALASLSAARQGRYRAFHEALFSLGRPTQESIIAAVRRARLNELQTARDMSGATMKAELRKNHELGRALGLTGTPAYVIGDRVLSGAVGYDELKKAIEAARAAG
jgi:protein-disulfide isomerase